jgi:hypothetical protein
VAAVSGRKELSHEDDAKLIFGVVFSLRKLVKQLGGEDNRCRLQHEEVHEPSLNEQ